MTYALSYRFSQHFDISAKEAYNWCTDFQPEDHALMGEENAEREVSWLTDSTIILKETFHTGKGEVAKVKLVQLYPDRFMWISTHISGVNMYSQFIYEIIPEADGSRLDFTALHMEHTKPFSKKRFEALVSELLSYDSDVWKGLAKTMEKELKG